MDHGSIWLYGFLQVECNHSARFMKCSSESRDYGSNVGKASGVCITIYWWCINLINKLGWSSATYKGSIGSIETGLMNSKAFKVFVGENWNILGHLLGMD